MQSQRTPGSTHGQNRAQGTLRPARCASPVGWLRLQCCEYLAGASETEALHPPLSGIINEPKDCGARGGGGWGGAQEGRRSKHTHPLPASGQTHSEPGFPHSLRGILNRRDRETSHLLSQWIGVFPAESRWEENTELGVGKKDRPTPRPRPPTSDQGCDSCSDSKPDSADATGESRGGPSSRQADG